ncbi:MAG: hypothetical protein E6I58_02220 [Chloroflexi bacterium]|nr:MAG: hypothetical protein E6I58_02220 [Chloroflexota bacterium]
MAARPTFHTASQRPLPSAAWALAIPARPRRPAIAMLAGLALLMMLAPVAVAAIAIVDSSLLAGPGGWFHTAATWLAAVAHARVFLWLPLAAMVARAREDS